MRILSKTKDGGPESHVDAFFVIEIKQLFSMALLSFNKGQREAFHTHAFTAWTWFLFGDMKEQNYDGTTKDYKRSLLPKVTRKDCNHRVIAHQTSWAFTIRGPWDKQWSEDTDDEHTVFTWGRKVVKKSTKAK